MGIYLKNTNERGTLGMNVDRMGLISDGKCRGKFCREQNHIVLRIIREKTFVKEKTRLNFIIWEDALNLLWR